MSKKNFIEGAKYSCVPKEWVISEHIDDIHLKINGKYILNISKLDDYDVFLEDNNLEPSDEVYNLWEKLVVGCFMYLAKEANIDLDPTDVKVGVDNSLDDIK